MEVEFGEIGTFSSFRNIEQDLSITDNNYYKFKTGWTSMSIVMTWIALGWAEAVEEKCEKCGK